MPEGEHQVYLCLGSNIQPEENLRRAINLLQERTRVKSISTCWESGAFGASSKSWPNFLNLGVYISTPLAVEELKAQILRPIENELGRVRGADKYAPRTMDIDVVVFDGQVLDTEIWRRIYLALIFAEMLPDLKNPETGETPGMAAERLKQGAEAVAHPELKFSGDTEEHRTP
jgi:2-amino-4-hydroxy-6-hydroxymethyldihydropteridine diphosphokinase